MRSLPPSRQGRVRGQCRGITMDQRPRAPSTPVPARLTGDPIFSACGSRRRLQATVPDAGPAIVSGKRWEPRFARASRPPRLSSGRSTIAARMPMIAIPSKRDGAALACLRGGTAFSTRRRSRDMLHQPSISCPTMRGCGTPILFGATLALSAGMAATRRTIFLRKIACRCHPSRSSGSLPLIMARFSMKACIMPRSGLCRMAPAGSRFSRHRPCGCSA